MNILVINWQDWTNPLAGGAETHLREIFRRLAARGHQVTLLCSGYPGAADEEEIDGIRIVRRGRRSTFNFGVPLYYRRMSRSDAFDIVVDDLNKIPFYTPLYVREPLVGIAHHFFGNSIFRETWIGPAGYVWGSEQTIWPVYRKTPFLVVSKSTADEMISHGFDPDNLHLAMNAVDLDRLQPEGAPKSAHPTVGYFGRLKRYKSVDHLFHAFARVRETIQDARLVVIGRGDFRPELEKLAARLGITDAVEFTGFVSEEEKVRRLQELWVVVNPSMKEGWGIVTVEANACGTPAIAADSPGLRDAVRDRETGELYPYGDLTSLTESLIRLLSHKELRERYRKNAIAFARSITWDESADVTERVLEETIERQKSPARR